jgi:2-dehydropantoate 2-reductase
MEALALGRVEQEEACVRVAILGAGGVGAYYGGLLFRAGHPVQLFARGANLEALRSSGLQVTTPEGRWQGSVPATDDPAALRGAELALISVKSYGLGSIAPVAADLATRGAVVLPLLNGVEAADQLQERGVPRPQILAGLTSISVERIAPGRVIRHSSFQRVVVGELEGGLPERASAVAKLFTEAGVEARASAEMSLELWRKFVFITTLAACCGMARNALGAVRSAPLGPLLLERTVAESVAVGRARGIGFPSDEEARQRTAIAALPDAMRPSFLVDLERGGPTELDILSGAVSRLGRDAGVPTTVHDTAVAVLSAALGTKGAAA